MVLFNFGQLLRRKWAFFLLLCGSFLLSFSCATMSFYFDPTSRLESAARVVAREASNSGTSSLVVASENSASTSIANNTSLHKYYFSTVASSTASEEFAVNRHCLGLSSLSFFQSPLTVLSPSGSSISTLGLYTTTTYSLFESEGKHRLGISDFFAKYSANAVSPSNSIPGCFVSETTADALVQAGYASNVDNLLGSLFSMKVDRIQSDGSIVSQQEQWCVLNVVLESSPDYIYFSKSLGNFIISYQPVFRYSFANISIFCFPRESPSMVRDTVLKIDQSLTGVDLRLFSWSSSAYQLSEKGNENLSYYLYPESSLLFSLCMSVTVILSLAQLLLRFLFAKKDAANYPNSLFTAPAVASFFIVLLVFPLIAYFGMMNVSLCTVFSIRGALTILLEFFIFISSVFLINVFVGKKRKDKTV